MKITNASFEILAATADLEKVLELAGRVCYKSEDRITEDSAFAFVSRMRNVLKHESVLEHGSITVRFIVDRGVSHELVRHRIASFSQESTRYCCYDKDKFGKEITVIEPCFFTKGSVEYRNWETACRRAEEAYFTLLHLGATAQEARSVLPTSLKTEVVMTANPREWNHVFHLRCDKAAHPQMREVMIPCRQHFINNWPSLFYTDTKGTKNET